MRVPYSCQVEAFRVSALVRKQQDSAHRFQPCMCCVLGGVEVQEEWGVLCGSRVGALAVQSMCMTAYHVTIADNLGHGWGLVKGAAKGGQKAGMRGGNRGVMSEVAQARAACKPQGVEVGGTKAISCTTPAHRHPNAARSVPSTVMEC